MEDREYIENLIARSLNGECTREEFQELKEWIETNPENRNEYLGLKDIWDVTRQPKSTTEDQLVLFYQNQFENAKKSRKLWITYSSAIAAVLLIGLFISFLIPQQKSIHPGLQVFSVPFGSKSKVLLADGSVVSLNSGSELKYSSDFFAGERVVFLSGEAFFQVRSDLEHPFVVKTSDFDVKVSGTQFNVCTYSDNKYSSTTLSEGNIQVLMNGNSQEFQVKPGEKFELEKDTRKYRLGNADIESETAWKDGEFIFKKIPFPDLVQRLERWYDVKLNYSGVELQNFEFTGRFKNQETIWQVLDALKLTSPIDYRKTTFREFTIIYKPLK